MDTDTILRAFTRKILLASFYPPFLLWGVLLRRVLFSTDHLETALYHLTSFARGGLLWGLGVLLENPVSSDEKSAWFSSERGVNFSSWNRACPQLIPNLYQFRLESFLSNILRGGSFRGKKKKTKNIGPEEAGKTPSLRLCCPESA